MMGAFTTLKAGDGHELSAYVALPEGAAVGGLVLVQEIFGVNAHIRGVADGYAKDGFVVVAPALFDRYEKGVELKYDGADMQKAYELYGKLDPATVLLDVAAAFDEAKAQSGKDVAVVGYCYGGFTSWITATRGETVKVQPACAVGYYAGGIGKVAAEEPSCPVMLHFGGKDTHIGPEQIEAVRAAHPEVTIYEYPEAEHGFNCDARGSYNPEAAKLARERTLAFLQANLS
jgi:carboxymethylenebutenolidase